VTDLVVVVVVVCVGGEVRFDLVEPLAHRLGQAGVHVRGHGQRRGGERCERRGHGIAAVGHRVRERFEYDKHERVRVRHEPGAGRGPDRDWQQFADQRPREHEHAGRAAAREHRDADQRQQRRGRRAAGERHQGGRARHGQRRDDEQRPAADVRGQRARRHAGQQPDGAQRHHCVHVRVRSYDVGGAGHRPYDGHRVKYHRVTAAQLLQQEHGGQHAHRPGHGPRLRRTPPAAPLPLPPPSGSPATAAVRRLRVRRRFVRGRLRVQTIHFLGKHLRSNKISLLLYDPE